MEQNVDQQEFRVCPRCGRATPADNPECVECGLRADELIAQAREEARTRRFINALIDRSNPFTYLFIGVNLGMFLLLWLAGGMDLMAADQRALVEFGAKENTAIHEQGEYWRFVTSIFLHIGFLHIFFNNYALWIIGQEIERLYGSARFVVLYLLTGVAGSVASFFYRPEAASAGASGAIFGLFGVLAVFAFRYRKEIPHIISRDIKRRVIPLIAINLGIGWLIPMIDNSAHVGGLLTGGVLALLVPYKRPEERQTGIVWRALQVACISLIALSFIAVYRAYDGPPLQTKNLIVRPAPRVIDYHNKMIRGLDAYKDSNHAFIEAGKKDEANPDLSRALAAVDKGLESLDGLEQMDPEPERYRTRLRDLLIRQKGLLERFAGERPKDLAKVVREENDLTEAYERLEKEYREWLPGYLAGYGLEQEKRPGTKE
ncbi:MAG TPA: rhomboid family intramembrane serine protease [Blastocatellia bacterium]|nr:rhomboid family intramembrane serine protease [Blastocatellia bacterium]